MSPDERLRYEARARTRQIVVAVLAAVLLMVAAVITLLGPHASVSELTLELITANKRSTLDVIAAVLNALGSLTLAWTLVYLYGAARHRHAKVQPWLRILAIVGGAAAALSGVGYAILIAVKAHQFVTTGTQTYLEAHNLTSGGALTILQLLGQASALVLAFAFVMIALGAMRVGLLTRFMGYLGVVAGVLILFQITQLPIVQAYWLAAFGYLLSGRWPTGVPPAWITGTAEPWPPSQRLRGQQAQAGASRDSNDRRRRGAAKPAPAPAPETVGAPTPRSSRANTPKRKRKRRK